MAEPNLQANPQIQRLDIKGIKKAKAVAERDIGDCSSVILVGDRMTALPDFVDPKNARDLTSGNRLLTIFDFVAGIMGVKKQASVYQDIRGKLIAGEFESVSRASTLSAPVAVAVPKMIEQKLPENVLDFTVPFAAPTAPRPGRS